MRPINIDVVVIGSGVVGLCVAQALQNAGREITVVSRDPVGEGASSGNAGMIVPSHIVPLAAPGVIGQGLRWLADRESPFQIRPRLDRDLVRWLFAFRRHCTKAHVTRSIPVLRDLSLASVDAYAALQDEVGDVGFEQSGLVMVHHSLKGEAANAALADRAEAAGLRITRLDAEGVRAHEPALATPTTGGVLFHQDGRVDPDALLRRLAARLREKGASLHEGAEVTALHTHAGRIAAVSTTAGTFTPHTVVLAAGSWSSALAEQVGVRVPLQPAKGYSITVPAPPDGPRLPMILTEEKLTVTPMNGRLRFAGTLALTGWDASVDTRRVDPLRRLAAAYGVASEAASVWAGFRPCSPDGLPYVGRSPRHENLFVAAGHGMMGVSLGPATGALMGALVMGTPPPVDPTPFRVGR